MERTSSSSGARAGLLQYRQQRASQFNTPVSAETNEPARRSSARWNQGAVMYRQLVAALRW